MKDTALPTEYPIDLTPYTYDGKISTFLIKQKLETIEFGLEGLILTIIYRNINKTDIHVLYKYEKSIQLLIEKSHDISEFFRYSVCINIPLGYNVLPLIIEKMMIDKERLPIIIYNNDEELCVEIERYINEAKSLKLSKSNWESTPKNK